MQNIIGSPWLRNDQEWKQFMRPGALNSGGLSAPIEELFNPSDNTGVMQLIACLRHLNIPYKYTMTQRMEDVKIEVQIIEKQGMYMCT